MSTTDIDEVAAVETAKDASPLGPTVFDDDRTIYERLWAITAELPAIGKTQRNTQQNFNFRGHDDVLNALNPLLSKHGVIIVPNVLERIASSERTTKKGDTMYEVNLHVAFDFYGAKGDSLRASTWGEGTDMGDKATSKALTMAFKYALAQVFAVSTAEDYDPDSGAPEETRARGRRSDAQATQAAAVTTVQASSWTEWTSLMKDYGVVEAESREWLAQAAFAINLDKTEKPDELWQRANAALGKLAEYNDGKGVLFVEGARGIVAAAFGYAFKGQLVPGPEWRLDPTEGDRPTYHDWEQAQQAEAAPAAPAEPEAEDIPFGTEEQVAEAKAFTEPSEDPT